MVTPTTSDVTEVTLGSKVSLNIYDDDGNVIAYNKHEMWAEVKAVSGESARIELEKQMTHLLSEYEKLHGKNRKKNKDSASQIAFADYAVSTGQVTKKLSEFATYSDWKNAIPQEVYNSLRQSYIAITSTK